MNKNSETRQSWKHSDYGGIFLTLHWKLPENQNLVISNIKSEQYPEILKFSNFAFFFWVQKFENLNLLKIHILPSAVLKLGFWKKISRQLENVMIFQFWENTVFCQNRNFLKVGMFMPQCFQHIHGYTVRTVTHKELSSP